MSWKTSFLRDFPQLSTPTRPTPVAKPELLLASEDVKALLGLNDLDPQLWSGNQIHSGAQPYATRYGGHQFGHWAGQLGDGRVIFLGELQSKQDATFEIQLKGAGPTPYSRRGDGRAVLRSSLREHLCSEAMAGLGVPTTRSLCCLTTGESVMRDLFYDGNPALEPGAIICRVAPSFLRFGHFQILAADRDLKTLGRLSDWVGKNGYGGISMREWFFELCERTARLMTEWQRVGFVHGVMNTDNFSIFGLTLDYGPYGWMDIYDPNFTPNTTDFETRRYRFSNQPSIAFWNLHRLADALSLLIPDDINGLREGLDHFSRIYNQEVLVMISNKLGIPHVDPPSMLELATELDSLLQESETDMTIFFREFSKLRLRIESSAEDWAQVISKSQYQSGPLSPSWTPWIKKIRWWMQQAPDSPEVAAQKMNQFNPYFVLRNYLVQEALEEWMGRGDRKLMDQLAQALRQPYVENHLTQAFYKKMPENARNKPGCSALSCSS